VSWFSADKAKKLVKIRSNVANAARQFPTLSLSLSLSLLGANGNCCKGQRRHVASLSKEAGIHIFGLAIIAIFLLATVRNPHIGTSTGA
jgi:hypothetical protein